jgi:hypothetical protein
MPADGGRRLVLCQGGPFGAAHLTPITPADGESHVPEGAALITSRRSRALAFLGPDGWEAWSVGDGGLARRAVAERCLRPGALFTPDGETLVVPGRVDGLYRLDLADGSMNFMVEGNPGLSRRVGQSWDFRQVPAPDGGLQWVLLSPQWDMESRLQIVQAHLRGAGREFMTLGGAHHYGVSLSRDGRLLAYTQAAFDEQENASFVEDVYLFGFDAPGSPAILLESRRGGRSDQGPVFVGDGSSLVYLADGDAVRIDVRSPTPER